MSGLRSKIPTWLGEQWQWLVKDGRTEFGDRLFTFSRATVEVFVLTAGTWLPLLLLQWRLTGSLAEYPHYYSNILYGGQLIVLAMAMFGGILWAAVLSDQVVVGITHKISLAVGITGIFLVVFVYGENPSLNNRLTDEYATVSEAVYWMFVAIQLALSYVNRRQPRNIGQALRKGADNLLDKYQQLETK